MRGTSVPHGNRHSGAPRQRRTRNPYSGGRCSWIPGCLASRGPRNDRAWQAAALRLALFRLDRLLGFWVHPPAVEPKAVFWRDLRPTELVPMGDPIGSEMEIRDHVVAVLQDAIEGAGMGDEARPIWRDD